MNLHHGVSLPLARVPCCFLYPINSLSPCRQKPTKAWAREGSPAGGQVCSSPGLRALNPHLRYPFATRSPGGLLSCTQGQPLARPSRPCRRHPKVSKGRAESPLVRPQAHPPPPRAASAKKKSPRAAPPEECRGERKAPAVPAGTLLAPRGKREKKKPPPPLEAENRPAAQAKKSAPQ